MPDEILKGFSLLLLTTLNNLLPKIKPEWWDSLVIDNLSFQQQSYAKQKNYSKLEDLDLAALIRVFDQNWYELSQLIKLDFQARTWLKESQSIRNRWAHAPIGGIEDETYYRDIDTLGLLSATLNADKSYLDLIQKAKQSLIKKLNNEEAVIAPQTVSLENLGPFAVGNIVRLKARQAITGAIVAKLNSEEDPSYQVFQDGRLTTYFASQLELVSIRSTENIADLDSFNALMTASQLRNPAISKLYSLASSRINFVPYQYRPVLKFIKSDRPRMLIADEVGVGKTIESGLILSELKARTDLKNVLIICPKPLVAEHKWITEMKRFDENFVHLESSSLKYCIDETHLDGAWPSQYARSILPYSLLDESLLLGKSDGKVKRKGMVELDPPPMFDLVIVDEAHHIRNPDTWAHRNVRYFCDNAQAVIFLTATPIQLGNEDLYHLLHLIRPDIILDKRTYSQMSEPNPYINHAIEVARGAKKGWESDTRESLRLALTTDWGRSVLLSKSDTQEIYDELSNGEVLHSRRIEIIGQLEEMYTFSGLINRTRRRDIGNFTTRKPNTVLIKFTDEQSNLHSDLINLITRMLRRRHGDQNLGFMLTTLRRQLASCVFGLAPLLNDFLGQHLNKIELSELGDESDVAESNTFLEFESEIKQLISKTQTLSSFDPKFEALQKIILDKQDYPNNKILLFSTFRHTLSYLLKQLQSPNIRLGLIHGDIPDDERREIRKRFALPKENSQAIDLVLSSEVGCEGLDFQFCDALVNYDLPWNPMRVEQRIGRIDRYGQQSEAIAIYNLITPGTVDAEIYERCLVRIGVFRQSIGGSEEILGVLTKEINNIANNLALTEEERSKQLQQLADNEIREIQEQSKLEEEQSKLFGLSVPNSDEAKIKEASSIWLSPQYLANMLCKYFESMEIAEIGKIVTSKDVHSLRLSAQIKEKLILDCQSLAMTGKDFSKWISFLKSDDSYLVATFDPAVATERPDIAFLSINHPLVKQAAKHLEPASQTIVNVDINSSDIEAGNYKFGIYRWHKVGIKDDFEYKCISTNAYIEARVFNLLPTASVPHDSIFIENGVLDSLEKLHYKSWTDSRANWQSEIKSICDARESSLRATHSARVKLFEEQLATATDSRIRKMRESQINSAENDFQLRLKELSLAKEQCDIVWELIAYGNILVRGDL
jgi:ATP-dependent helicase HepA